MIDNLWLTFVTILFGGYNLIVLLMFLASNKSLLNPVRMLRLALNLSRSWFHLGNLSFGQSLLCRVFVITFVFDKFSFW